MSDMWVDHVSFSQLTMAMECPYEYYLLKIAGVTPVQNGFAEAGTLAHQLLAGWARGELKKEDLLTQWIERFATEVNASFPKYLVSKGYVEKLFSAVLEYFEKFNGFPGYEVVGAEQQFTSSIAGERFEGIIDLILRDKKSGKLMIVDHKSCSLSSFRKSKEAMYRQLLLYSKFCADQFGEFPEKLCFNLFKERICDERPFTQQDYVSARVWAEEVISAMRNREITDWFETKPDFFRCTNLCSSRKDCSFGLPENHMRKENKNGKRTTAVA